MRLLDRLLARFGYIRAPKHVELRKWAVERAIEINPNGGGWQNVQYCAQDILQFVVWQGGE